MKKFLVSLIFIVLTIKGYTQKEGHFLISAVPTSIFYSSLQVDLEKSISKRTALLVGPELIYNKIKTRTKRYAETEEDRQRTNPLTGFGINSGIKIYTNPIDNPAFYFGWIINYRHLSVDYQGEEWVKIVEDGLPYYISQPTSKKLIVNQGTFQYIIGYTAPIKKTLILDFFIGTGLRRSFLSGEKDADVTFSENMYRPAYTGAFFLTGIKIGGRVKKDHD